MNKKDRQKFSTESLLSILALLAGIVALVFSWQANRIAEEANRISSQEFTSQVATLSSDYNGGAFHKSRDSDEYTVRCRQVIRLANLGGAPASLIGYDAEIFYKDLSRVVTSDDPDVIDTNPFNSTMHNFQFTFLDRDTLNETANLDPINPQNYLVFPFQIEGYTSIDIDTAVTFILAGTYHGEEIEMPRYEYQYEHPKSAYNSPPLEVVYTLRMASGQVTTTPKTLCLYLK